MISFLAGIIKNKTEKSATILTNTSVGYKVFLPISTLFSIEEGSQIELLIHTVVKDDAIDLYGFRQKEEMQIFEKLITVSGVGPKSALNILSLSSTQNIILAIENNDAKSLSTIPGLGKKSAEKIIIELKGKLTHLLDKSHTNKNTESLINKEEDDAKLALISLGYNEKNISETLSEIKKEEQDRFAKMKTSEIIREALKSLR